MWRVTTAIKRQKKSPALPLRPNVVVVVVVISAPRFFTRAARGKKSFRLFFEQLYVKSCKILQCASTLTVNKIRQPQSNKQTDKHRAPDTSRMKVIISKRSKKLSVSFSAIRCYSSEQSLMLLQSVHVDMLSKKLQIYIFAYCTFSWRPHPEWLLMRKQITINFYLFIFFPTETFRLNLPVWIKSVMLLVQDASSQQSGHPASGMWYGLHSHTYLLKRKKIKVIPDGKTQLI